MTGPDIELLRWIATPEVNGVPGACQGKAVGGLLAAGFVRFGCAPTEAPTINDAWVSLTDGGWEWLRDNPAETRA
jgi:hypothetical protein